MIDNILFACDFSASAERALAYGVDLVGRTGATLHVLHIREVAMGPFVGGEPSPEAGKEERRAQHVEQCREAMAPYALGPDDEQVSCVVERSAAAAPALVEYADAHGADLVLMGTQGRRGLQRALFGSVAEEVLRTAPCPVFTAQAAEEEVQPPASAAVQRIVVPVDFSDPSRNALQYAARLASVYDVPMTLAHVIQLPKIPTVYEVEFSELSLKEIEAKVKSELEEWGRSVPTETQDLSYVVESGDPVPTILRIASAPEDLIVMATQGLSGLTRQMLGSVAEGVLRRAPGPVVSAQSFPDVG